MVVLTWLESIFAIININILLKYWFGGRFKKATFLLLMIFIAAPIFVLSLATINTDYEFIFQTTAFCLQFLIPFFTIRKVSVGAKLYISFFYIGLSTTLITSMNWIFRSLGSSYYVTLSANILFLSFLLLMGVLIAKGVILKEFASQQQLIPKNMKFILIFSILVSDFLVSSISKLFTKFPYTTDLIIIQVLTALVIILIGILTPLIIATSISGAYFKTVSSNMEQQVNAQIQQYELLAQANKDVRRFKHDFDNLKIGLQRILSEGNTAEALDYLSECEQPLQSDYILYKTGNRLADALLHNKNQLAEAAGTSITFDGLIPDGIIARTDLCVMLGNALDNALEACRKIESAAVKTITLTSDYQNRFLFITVQNPVADEVKIVQNKIETTKENKQQHGIGLSSIRKAAANYSGEVKVLSENGVFTLKIELDLNDA